MARPSGGADQLAVDAGITAIGRFSVSAFRSISPLVMTRGGDKVIVLL
jgi:hypothetical protein